MSNISGKRRKKILLVTYVFPPYAAVGVYRILKFCKYLPEFGYDPVILTPEAPNVLGRDESLLDQVDARIPVYRTPSLEPFRVRREEPSAPAAPAPKNPGATVQEAGRPHPLAGLKRVVKANLSVPDSSLLWTWSGFGTGKSAIRKEDIDVILSSSPPQSVHLLGHRLARRTRRPLVVDFRDLWTQNTSYHERDLPGYLRRRNRNLERKVLRDAAGIAVNTSTFQQQLLANNPFLDGERIAVVNNGVDPDDFRDMVDRARPNERFTVLYTGSLYGDHRDPEFFLRALRSWLDRSPHVRPHVKVRFIGNWTPKYLGIIDRFDLGDVVEKVDWMPQREALAETFAADLLLLIQGFDPVLSAALPRKLFEYMITDKPILAFAPAGEIPEVMGRYDCGDCLSTTEASPIIEILAARFAEWEAARASGEGRPACLRAMPDLETWGQVQRLVELCDRTT